MQISSRLVLGFTVAGVVLAGFIYLVGEWRGHSRGIREEAQLSKRSISEQQARLAASFEAQSKLGAQLDALRRGKLPHEVVDKDTPASTPYTASDQELSDESNRFRSFGGLILSKRFYLVAGQPAEIYWRGIVPIRDPETFIYSIKCSCEFAINERRRIALTPPADAAGSHTLEIMVSDAKGKLISRGNIELVVVPWNAGQGNSFEMLMVGDSLGDQGRFPNRLAHLLGQPGNPTVSFVGSHRPAGAEISHEQYGGWGFVDFITRIGANLSAIDRDRSPFVFGVQDGNPIVDVRRYLVETLGGAMPRNIHIQLGINDAFALSPDGADLDKQLAKIIANAEILIASFKKALPDSTITIGSLIQGNASERAYIESFPSMPQFNSEWRWRQIQMRLARLMVEHFEQAESRNIFLVPTHMTVDSLDGFNAHPWTPDGVDYSLSNAVHPSVVGERQLAGTIYATVKAELVGLVRHD